MKYTKEIFILLLFFMLLSFIGNSTKNEVMFYDPRVSLLIDGQLGGNVSSVATDAEVTAAVAGGTGGLTMNESRTNITQTVGIDGAGSTSFDIPFLSVSDGTYENFTLNATTGDLSLVVGTLASQDQTLTDDRTITTGAFDLIITGLPEYNGDTLVSIKPDGTLGFMVQGGNVQTHTSGSTLTVLSSTEVVYVDPTAFISNLTINLPSITTNKIIEFHFGGTIAAGNPVVINLTLPVSVLGGSLWSGATSSDGFSLRYNSSNSKWYFK